MTVLSTQCGANTQIGEKFCAKCGRTVSAASSFISTPATAPQSEGPTIWNPNAASNWSLIFSPAFGSYLHAQSQTRRRQKEYDC